MKIIIDATELDDMLTKYYTKELQIDKITCEAGNPEQIWFYLSDNRALGVTDMNAVLSCWYGCVGYIENLRYSVTTTDRCSIVIALDKELGGRND